MLPELHRIKDHYFWLTALVIAKNSITREYQNSFLGTLWTVIIPLIQVVVFAIIMPLIISKPMPNYALYLVVSFSLWTFISNSLVIACHAIISQAETIKRCIVSAVIFPVADVLKQTYTYLLSFLLMYLFCLLLGTPASATIGLFPLVFAPIFIAVLALSIAISYLAPYVRDVGYLVQLAMNILFWFTPIVYPLSAVPEHYHWLFWLNPFYILIHPVQQLAYAGTLPTLTEYTAMLAVMIGAIVCSYALFRLCRRNYVYYL